MQIGADVSSRSYAPYKSNTRSDHFARYMEKDDETAFGASNKESVGRRTALGDDDAVARTESTQQEESEEVVNYQEFIRKRMDEILEKVKKGDTEPSIQTGAQSFTEKEWDKLIEGFDSAEEELRKLMREEHAKRLKENVNKTEIINSITSEEESMLVSEKTTCSYPSADPQKEDVRYITWYTEEGIFCRKAGQSEGYEWSLTFENSGQYHDVMAFLRQFSKEDNLRFAAHKNFWEDFLNDKIDLQEFMEFYRNTEKDQAGEAETKYFS